MSMDIHPMKYNLCIEIADFKYWKYLNYEDGQLYCQLMDVDGKNNWRIIKSYSELDLVKCRGVMYHLKRRDYKKIKPIISNEYIFYEPDAASIWRPKNGWIIPVRNI